MMPYTVNWHIVRPPNCDESSLSATLGEVVNPADALADQYTYGELIDAMAVDMLYNLTDQRFGTRTVRVRPCRERCDGSPSRWSMASYSLPGGSTLDSMGWCGSCGPTSPCGCSYVPSIHLPGPVDIVNTVTIDGDTVDPSQYRLQGPVLYRINGETWPACQDLAKDHTEEGSFAVEYERGYPAPSGGMLAAGVLACELSKAFVGDKSCALPDRVQMVTRQGVTMQILDSFEELSKGRTGLPQVDMWLTSVNRGKMPSLVWSPDLPDSPRTQRI